ncbi:hypothetical protein KKG41_06735 [Patescibacteria group bacterium]|nr:hypothetical protein [Patescibacteria group bacterium]MBU1890139.1 hypothetical protein [Patescibacteria group bacterium]
MIDSFKAKFAQKKIACQEAGLDEQEWTDEALSSVAKSVNAAGIDTNYSVFDYNYTQPTSPEMTKLRKDLMLCLNLGMTREEIDKGWRTKQ